MPYLTVLRLAGKLFQALVTSGQGILEVAAVAFVLGWGHCAGLSPTEPYHVRIFGSLVNVGIVGNINRLEIFRDLDKIPIDSCKRLVN